MFPQAPQLNRKGTASEHSRGQNRLVPKMISFDTGAGLCAIRTSIVESPRGWLPAPSPSVGNAALDLSPEKGSLLGVPSNNLVQVIKLLSTHNMCTLINMYFV